MSNANVYDGMLEAIRAEKTKLKQQLEKLEEQERTIIGWKRTEGLTTLLPKPISQDRLSSFLRESLKDGIPRGNAELAELAKTKGILEGKIDLRKINAILLGLMKGGIVARKSDKWIAKKEER